MKWLASLFLFCFYNSYSQNVSIKLTAAINKLEVDSQFRHAIISIYVVESKTGNVIFEKNSQVGLALQVASKKS